MKSRRPPDVLLEPTSAKLRRFQAAFYAQQAEVVARALVGSILVRRAGGGVLRARIVETEAYVGTHDLACHASRGRTPRTEVMFGPAGRAYVYLIYGLHDMLNVVTGPVGDAQAVLIRGALPLDGWEADLSGPGRLAKALAVTRADNGLDLTGEALSFWRDPSYRPRVEVTERIGVDYAGAWKDALLRFVDGAALRSLGKRRAARP